MSPIQKTYQELYSSFTNLREHLYSSGRIDDSNAKLDELVKVLAICIAGNRDWIDSSELELLVNFDNHQQSTVKKLRALFKKCTALPQFKNRDGSSIFGANASLNLQDSENEYAFLLLKSVYSSFSQASKHSDSSESFDLINEAFGHFIRDNFRGNIEDAQYMTPPEVVDFVCDWALDELTKDKNNSLNKNFLVMDPSCGVGSFLASFYLKAGKLNKKYKKTICSIGQDKVDRMVRLSKINMMLFGTDNHQIEQGNSLVGNTFLEKYNGKVDLIITNPPFGAKISSADIGLEHLENYPLFNDVENLTKTIDSELLFIDRELSLLKEGGKLFVVVPDSTVSARGLSETLRARIVERAILKGVIELPAVTFAQAGTRTKTSILYLEKNSSKEHKGLTTMATVESLGFQVSMRKGVAIKKYEGVNELEVLKKKLFISNSKKGVVSETPSCVKEETKLILSNAWTASHYNAKRINATNAISAIRGSKSKELKDIVAFETKNRRRLKEKTGSKCISVLHIIGDGFINFPELLNYEPKTKGNVCFPGDILIAKINPRIPRVLVVPEFSFPTTCSNEFEILTVKDGHDPYWVAFLLQNDLVQDQIQSLTSGTSSSHNRIKTNELEQVKIPVPKTEKSKSDASALANNYKNSIESIVSNSFYIQELRGANSGNPMKGQVATCPYNP